MGADDDAGHLDRPAKELLRARSPGACRPWASAWGTSCSPSRWAARSAPQPARPAGRALRRRLDRPPGRRRRARRPSGAAARRGVHWNNDVVSGRRRGRVRWPRPPRARCRRPGSHRGLGRAVAPRGRRAGPRSWADGDRATTSSAASTRQALLAEIDAARAELDTAWRPLPVPSSLVGGQLRRTRELVRRSRLGRGCWRRTLREPRPAVAPARWASASATSTAPPDLAALGRAAEPLLALLGRTADPDLALAGLVRLAEARGRATRCSPRSPTTRARRCGCWRARRQRGAGRPPRPAPRALARAHRPDPRLDPAGGVRRPRRPAARGRRRPGRPDADRRRCPTPRRSTRCAWSTAACCCAWPHATSPTTSASTTPPPSSPTSRPARSTPRSPSPAQRVGRGSDGPGWRWSRWASAAATSSTTSPTST